MKWSKLLLIFISMIISCQIVSASIQSADNCEEVYFPNNFGKEVTTILSCTDIDNDPDNEKAEITEADKCQVTCTDPTDPNRKYMLQASGIVEINDESGGDDIKLIQIVVTYKDTEGNSYPLYNTYVEGSYDDEQSLSRGLIAYFGYTPPTHDDVVGYSMEYFDIDYQKSIYDLYPSAIWPLFYSSDLLFQLTTNAYSGTKQINAIYQHTLDFSNCEDTYLEFYFCGSDGANICPYKSNTAFLACYMHEENAHRAIISIDSEGSLQTS